MPLITGTNGPDTIKGGGEIDIMLPEYYEHRGWAPDGVPCSALSISPPACLRS